MLALASSARPLEGLSQPPDWTAVGIVLAIVGSFFLANAILFRHPRSLVREHFGLREGHLRSIREYIFHRVQIHLGFFFLLGGFGLQLFGRFRPPQASSVPTFPTAWVGVILLSAVVLELMGWWLSHRLFRGYVREHFLEHPAEFEKDMKLARELGALFGIESSADDTVQSYVARLRRQVGLPRPERGAERRPAAMGRSEIEVVEEELA